MVSKFGLPTTPQSFSLLRHLSVDPCKPKACIRLKVVTRFGWLNALSKFRIHYLYDLQFLTNVNLDEGNKISRLLTALSFLLHSLAVSVRSYITMGRPLCLEWWMLYPVRKDLSSRYNVRDLNSLNYFLIK